MVWLIIMMKNMYNFDGDYFHDGILMILVKVMVMIIMVMIKKKMVMMTKTIEWMIMRIKYILLVLLNDIIFCMFVYACVCGRYKLVWRIKLAIIIQTVNATPNDVATKLYKQDTRIMQVQLSALKLQLVASWLFNIMRTTT